MSVAQQILLANAPATDPFFANVSLLLHMDGTNGSTTFVDSSSSPKTVTAVGNTQISTVQKKFGTGSALFDGVNDSLTVASAATYDWLTNSLSSWTVEGWFYVPNTSGVKTLFVKGDNNTTMAAVICTIQDTDLAVAWYKSTIYGSVFSRGVGAVLPNVWNYFAIVYDAASRQLKTYLNGNGGTAATLEASSNYATPNGQVLRLGEYTSGFFDFTQYIDEFRITQGIARYTADFTPPSAPFPNS